MLKSQIGFSTTQSHLQNYDFIEIRKGTDHSQKSLRHIVLGKSINHNLCFYLVELTGAKKGGLSEVVWFQGALPTPTYLFSFTPHHRHKHEADYRKCDHQWNNYSLFLSAPQWNCDFKRVAVQQPRLKHSGYARLDHFPQWSSEMSSDCCPNERGSSL